MHWCNFAQVQASFLQSHREGLPQRTGTPTRARAEARAEGRAGGRTRGRAEGLVGGRTRGQASRPDRGLVRAAGVTHNETMRIALLQDTAAVLDSASNLAVIGHAARRAREGGARLLITPELFVHGYAPQRLRAELGPSAVEPDLQRLREIARASGIALICSLPGPGGPAERGIDAVYIDAQGSLRARYTKTHLFGPAERAAFVAGDQRPPVVEADGLRIGLLICYDVEFPECARQLALDGADLIAVPTALAGDFLEITSLIVPTRALENGVSVAYANHTGTSDGLYFHGRSLVAGPEGRALAAAGEEAELLFADISPRPHPAAAPGVAAGVAAAVAGPPASASGGDDAPGESEEDTPDYLRDRREALYRDWQATVKD